MGSHMGRRKKVAQETNAREHNRRTGPKYVGPKRKDFRRRKDGGPGLQKGRSKLSSRSKSDKKGKSERG